MRVKDVFDPGWLLNPAKVFPLALSEARRSGRAAARPDALAPTNPTRARGRGRSRAAPRRGETLRIRAAARAAASAARCRPATLSTRGP
jgi:hypothetical protein